MTDFSQLTVSQRVKYLIKQKYFTGARLSDLVGVTPQTVSELLSKGGDLPIKYLNEITKAYPDISLIWLMTGEGDIKAQPDIIKTKEFIKPGEKRHDTQDIPLYDITAAAGLNALHNSQNNVLDFLRIPNLTKCDGAIYIKGDSMYPLLKHGDIVAYQQITDLPEDIYFGEMYIVDMSTPHREKIVVKYVQKSELGPEYITLVSYNEKHHPPKDVHLSKVRAMAEVKASIRLT